MVGGAEEAFTLLGMPRTARYAHRTRQMEAAADTEGMGGHCSSHILRQDQGFVCLQLRQDRHKFLAAPASHRVYAPHPCPDQAGKLTQHGIASFMPIAIIERFEMIQIEEQERASTL